MYMYVAYVFIYLKYVLFKEPSLSYLFNNLKNLLSPKERLVKQKGSSDIKGSLWNHLDKRVLLWHREAHLFLRVHKQPIKMQFFTNSANLSVV